MSLKKIDNITGLTDTEKRINEHIIGASQLFQELPIQHPSDIQEWIFGIHILQGLLMQRIARRAFPKYWRNKEKEK